MNANPGAFQALLIVAVFMVLSSGCATSPPQVQAVEKLSERALKNPDSAERIAALQQLLDEGEPAQTIPIFISALKDDSATVRMMALDAIRATGNSKAPVPMEPILRTAEQDKDAEVRLTALRTAFKLDRGATLPVVERLAEDPDRAVQWRAQKYLEFVKAKGLEAKEAQ